MTDALPDEIAALVERAGNADLQYAVEKAELTAEEIAEDADPYYVTLHIPNGRTSRVLELGESDAARLNLIPFEHYTFLGDYDAVVDKRTGRIEARLAPLGSAGIPTTSMMRLSRLPGAGPLEGNSISGNPMSSRSSQPWALDVPGEALSLRMGTASPDLSGLLQARVVYSLTIEGHNFSTQESCISLLESVSRPFFFDLDLRYGVLIGLAARHANARRPIGKRSAEPPRFPSMTYLAEPLSLYNYGRSATRLPLLEFLAYYQTLEFFFPIFSRAETVRQMRRQLKSPTFDVMSDLHINKMLSVALGDSTGLRSERQQLRATLRACVEDDELADFIREDPGRLSILCGKKQVVRGVQQLNLSAGADLRDQVADRLYAIRCRVVHTKHEGDQSGVELLLPSSEEARSLTGDVAVAQYLARQALITTATPWQAPSPPERRGPQRSEDTRRAAGEAGP